jgi:hypothetical protein
MMRRLWLLHGGIVLGLLIVLSFWQMPLRAQDALTPTPQPRFWLAVGNGLCRLAPGDAVTYLRDNGPDTIFADVTPAPTATPAATSTADAAADVLPVYSLGEDCAALIPKLYAPADQVVWLALLGAEVADAPAGEWLALSIPEETLPAAIDGLPVGVPRQLDGRGRFLGCGFADQGWHICRVQVDDSDEAVLVEVPVRVGPPYIAPTPTAAISTPTPTLAAPVEAVPPASGGASDSGSQGGGQSNPPTVEILPTNTPYPTFTNTAAPITYTPTP